MHIVYLFYLSTRICDLHNINYKVIASHMYNIILCRSLFQTAPIIIFLSRNTFLNRKRAQIKTSKIFYDQIIFMEFNFKKVIFP